MPVLGGAIAGGGSLLGGIFGASGATDAASIAAKAQNRATDLQGIIAQVIQGQLNPFLSSGTNANNVLSNLVTGPGSQFAKLSPQDVLGGAGAPTFESYLTTAGGDIKHPFLPTSQFTASPGYQYALQQAQDATTNSGAARTGAFSGNTLEALQRNAQGLASQDYWTANNAWMQNINNQFGADTSNYWNQYNAVTQNKGNLINWLTNLSNSGQNAAAQQGGAFQTLGGNAASSIIGGGNARAAGTLGANNALTSGFNGVANAFTGGATNNNQGGILAALATMFGGGGGGGASLSGVTGYSPDFTNAALGYG